MENSGVEPLVDAARRSPKIYEVSTHFPSVARFTFCPVSLNTADATACGLFPPIGSGSGWIRTIKQDISSIEAVGYSVFTNFTTLPIPTDSPWAVDLFYDLHSCRESNPKTYQSRSASWNRTSALEVAGFEPATIWGVTEHNFDPSGYLCDRASSYLISDKPLRHTPEYNRVCGSQRNNKIAVFPAVNIIYL